MIIGNVHLLMNGKMVKKDISIGSGKIMDIGDNMHGDGRIDLDGLVALPGLHNNHMHASTILIRGTPTRGNLDDWVEDVLWQFEKDLNEREVYYGALYSICQMLRSGITYFEDMHFIETQVLKACEEGGIRASLSEALMDLNDWGEQKASVDSTLSLARKAKTSDLVDVKMGIVSVRLTSEDMLDEIVGAVADNPNLFKGYHIHLNEVALDQEYSIKEHGMAPTTFFDSKGLIGPQTTLAHCIHMKDEEVQLLSGRNAKVALCPASNLRLRSGVAPVGYLISKGVNLSMGLDSPAINDGFDLFSDARLLGLMNGIAPGKLLEVLFDKAQLLKGENADIIFIRKEDLFPFKFPESTLAYGVNSGIVEHVMVNGRFVVFNKELISLDEEKIRKRARDLSLKALSRFDPQ